MPRRDWWKPVARPSLRQAVGLRVCKAGNEDEQKV